MKKFHLSLQWKFLLSIALIIFPSLGLIFVWAGFQHERMALEQVINQARILSKQIILTRQWVSDCDGVMVNRQSKGAQGVVCFFDDRMKTPRGWYQKFTPSMVTMKLSEYSNQEALYRYHLASLNPLNPKNKAKGFEEKALKRFRGRDLSEVYKVEGRGKESFFQYIVPLYVQETCIGCHKEQGFRKGDVRGGLSLFFPIGEMKLSLVKDHLKLAFAGVVLIMLTVFTLFVLLRRMVIRPMKDMEKMTTEISKGNLEARVDIATGDEVEKLGQAFNSMAERISKGRDGLREKIKQATSELAEANQELQSLDKLKSDFLANMSHELRSPLTVIRGGIDYLNRTIKGQENRRYLSIIDKNLTRLIHLVSDLFDFTKIEADKVEWSFERENLSRLVQEVIEIIGPLSMDKNININYEYHKDIYAHIDLERIEQVLVNLIENAIKFSEEGTEIQIDIGEDETTVLVAVRDHGIGISRENIDYIFEKFHTLPSSGGSQKNEGTGLGLAISKGIIEAHGGGIWAESKNGEGSIFFFTLPKRRS